MFTIVTFLCMRRDACNINDEATLGQEISCLASASYYLTQITALDDVIDIIHHSELGILTAVTKP